MILACENVARGNLIVATLSLDDENVAEWHLFHAVGWLDTALLVMQQE